MHVPKNGLIRNKSQSAYFVEFRGPSNSCLLSNSAIFEYEPDAPQSKMYESGLLLTRTSAWENKCDIYGRICFENLWGFARTKYTDDQDTCV